MEENKSQNKTVTEESQFYVKPATIWAIIVTVFVFGVTLAGL
jgi:hypothetical protein